MTVLPCTEFPVTVLFKNTKPFEVRLSVLAAVMRSTGMITVEVNRRVFEDISTVGEHEIFVAADIAIREIIPAAFRI